jgi:hypothetical protein
MRIHALLWTCVDGLFLCTKSGGVGASWVHSLYRGLHLCTSGATTLDLHLSAPLHLGATALDLHLSAPLHLGATALDLHLSALLH